MTFESQLLELLREYTLYYAEKSNQKSVLSEFRDWLSKRVEEKDEVYDMRVCFLKYDADMWQKTRDLQSKKLDKLEGNFYGVPITITLRESN
jgi:hypothetical protein